MSAKLFSHLSATLLRFFLIASIIFLASPITPARADTSVCGSVSGTWTSVGNNYIVTCDIQVLTDTTLTIQPGVVVKFNDGTSLQIDGTLVAQGATFTSNYSYPTAGRWGNIYFTASSEDASFDAEGNYVSGSKLQDSLVEWGGGAEADGAVDINGASPFIDHNTVRDSSARGIYAVGRSTAKRVVIQTNSVSGSNGGINVSAGYLVDNTISDNDTGWDSGDFGGGIYASTSILETNLVTNNTSSNSGGGIYASGSILLQNTVSGNSSPKGSGIYASGGSLTENQVLGNHFTGGVGMGGGIYAAGGTITGNIVTGNSLNCSYTVNGGGIYASLSTISGNTVTDNTAVSIYEYAYGGGIYSSSSSLSGNTISNNSTNAGTNGDVPFTAYGGGVYASGGTLAGNTLENNHASGDLEGLGGGIYADIATVQGNTLESNGANRGGAIFANQGFVTSNTVLTNTTSLTGTLYIDQGTATQNTLQGNTAVYGGGIYGTQATLTGNTLLNNTANWGAGMYASQSTVRGNTLTGNSAQSDGGGIFATGGTLTNNILTLNTTPSWGHGSGAYLLGVTDFSYNSVLTNTASGGTAGGISIEGQPQVHYNNLYGNSPYDAEVVSSSPVSSTLNYWGLSTCNAIPGQIYDGHDVPGRGMLSYAPSLYLPSPVAQLAVPGDLTIDYDSSSITLTWTPLTPIPNIGCRVPGSAQPDLAYQVYYDTDGPCAPYDGSGLSPGDSPIQVNQPTLTINAPGIQAYYFTVTSYDYLQRESAYSNIVFKPFAGVQLFLPLIKH